MGGDGDRWVNVHRAWLGPYPLLFMGNVHQALGMNVLCMPYKGWWQTPRRAQLANPRV